MHLLQHAASTRLDLGPHETADVEHVIPLASTRGTVQRKLRFSQRIRGSQNFFRITECNLIPSDVRAIAHTATLQQAHRNGFDGWKELELDRGY